MIEGTPGRRAENVDVAASGGKTRSVRAFPISIALSLVVSGCDRGSPPAPQASTTAVVSDAPRPSAAPSASAASSGAPAPSAASGATAKLPADLNVIMITVDSMRADMPWAGYERPIAPRLTELEKKSVSYTKAYALSSYTSMSVGGFLAGNYPGCVKRDGFFFGTYPNDVLMFPERLQQAGVRTMAVQAHGYFKPGTGLSQGFDVWKIVPGLKWNAQTDENVTSPEMEKMAEEMLSDPQNTSKKFFAWFHFMDPHDMYVSHKDGTSYGKKARDLYDGEVEYTDKHIGMLLDFIAKQPWASKTAIVVSADHGEAFGEHSIFRHGFEIFQSLVRVPWFFVIPGVPAKHVDVARSHLDLAPTVLDLLGVKADPPLPGASLVAEMTGQEQPGERDVIVDLPRTSDNDRRRALITGKYKVIAYSDDAYYQVYDLETDPDETKDLVKSDKETARAQIEKYKAAVKPLRDVKAYACKTLKGTPDNP
jgi:arylsulfatase A-like enzyme